MNTSLVMDLKTANQLLAQSQLFVRQATQDDLPHILTLEQLTSAYPCSQTQLTNCIEQTYVLIYKNNLIGFSVIALVEDQAELHSIAINPENQGQGQGSLFLQAVIHALPEKVEQFFLEVRVSNYRAIRLYHRMGFKKIAERNNYYPNGLGREDAVVMARECS
jgi:ribosomal-protein-alanine N-acetyltransferase